MAIMILHLIMPESGKLKMYELFHYMYMVQCMIFQFSCFSQCNITDFLCNIIFYGVNAWVREYMTRQTAYDIT